MKLCPAVLSLLVVFLGVGEAIPTWPAAIDELEDVMFLNTGYKSRGFSAHITPCSFSEFGPGRQTAAEWLRIGFHDMSTANVNFAPHGGIDGSIAWELNSGENIGAGFATSLTTYSNFFNSQLSLSDMIALGVYASVRGCGGPVVPMRGGRIDKLASGPIGVPQPQNGQGVFVAQFSRMGFNATQMIQMTACGHTLGGVHAADQPLIVPAGSAPDDFQLMDDSFAFDNAIATRYINGPNTDPMSVGIAVSSGRDADNAVFTADGNVTMRAMTDPAVFNSMCSTILQQMIEVVDPTIVTLSDIIQPYEVKPSGLQLELSSGGTQLIFSGDIRVRTTTRSAAQIASVVLTYTDRNGAAGGTISTTVSGSAAGFDDNFAFYGFSKAISSTTSISSFTVAITLTAAAGGTTTTYNNNGAGFPVSDSVIVQLPQSCFNNGNLTAVAAVRNSVAGTPAMTVTQKVPVTRPKNVPIPTLVTTNVTMVQGATLGPYSIYTGIMTAVNVTGAKFGVVSGASSDNFKDVSALGTSCLAIGVTPSSSSTSTPVSSTSSTSSTSATPLPTLSHKQTVGAYTFKGCYTEGNGVRALSGASFYDYNAMTLEKCALDCVGWTWFGVEYGGECYCGSAPASSSTLTTLGDCNFVCPGSQYEYCGAGSRLEMYELTSAVTTSSVSTTKSSSTSSSTPIKSSTSTSSPSTVSTSKSSSHSTTKSTSSIKSSTGSIKTSTSSSKSSTSSHKSTTSSSKTSTSSKSSTSSVKSSTSSVKSSTSSIKTSTTSKSITSSSKTSSKSSATSSSSKTSTNSIKTSSTSSSTVASTSTAPTLGIKQTVGAYSYIGCYTEATSGRALSAASFYDYPAMTLEECATSCASYNYFGVEYGGECYCGNSIDSTAGLATVQTDCNFVCPGNQYEYCGAGNRLEMYKKGAVNTVASSSSTSTSTTKSSTLITSTTKATTSTTSTSTSKTSSSTTSSAASTSQTALGIKPVVGSYKYYGCQTEATGMRALSGGSFYDYNAMTLEECAANCKGFKYFGVEYGGECYCGNSFNTGSVSASNSDCSFVCPGNAFEYCGAGNRLTTYVLA